MVRVKIHTKGELLLIVMSNFILFTLTKYEGDFSFTDHLDGKPQPKRIVVDQNKFNESGKVCELLEPFMNKSKSSLYRYHSPSITNTELPKDFDSMKLYKFRSICIESLKEGLPMYLEFIKTSKTHLELLEKIAKDKNKVPKTKTISNDILGYTHIINQFNYMIETFSDAKKPDDLIKLELFKK